MKTKILLNRSGESPDVTRRQCRNSLESIVSRLSVASLICVLMLTLGAGNAWGTLPASPTWTATALGSIPDGSTVIIISSSSHALPSTTTGSNPAKISCTVSTSAGVSTISPASGTLQNLAWTLTKSSSNYKFYQEGSNSIRLFLNGTSSATALRVGNAESSNDEFVMGTESKLLKVTTAGRYVGPYSSGSDWRTYTSETHANYGGATLTFYVLNSSCTEITPSLTYSSTSLTVCGSNATVTGISGNTCSATPTYAVTAASPAGCITVNASTGEVTPVAAGSATVTATFPKTSTCCAATATKSFTVSAASARTVSWYVEGSVSTTTSVVPGNQATPPTPDPTSSCGGDFVGWVAAGDDVVGDKPSDNNITPPSTIYTSSNKPTITCDGNVEFHAVFRKN